MHFCRIMEFIVVIMILVLAMPDSLFDVAFSFLAVCGISLLILLSLHFVHVVCIIVVFACCFALLCVLLWFFCIFAFCCICLHFLHFFALFCMFLHVFALFCIFLHIRCKNKII